jgi:predicted ATPase/class 3 adenylate cyclase
MFPAQVACGDDLGVPASVRSADIARPAARGIMYQDFQGGRRFVVSAQHRLPHGQVTFLFTDIEGSTRLAQVLGEGYRAVLTEHRRLLHDALVARGGTPISTEGDALFVVFPDAAGALAACAAAQRALTSHRWPSPAAQPRVRMGLHTGPASPIGTEYTSPEVHRAARVAAAAHGGQVLCSAATAAAAGAPLRAPSGGGYWLLDLGLHRLRGFDGRERLYQLLSPGLARDFPRPRTQNDVPHNLPAAVTGFVGRERERVELAALLAAERLVTVVGTGGAGKSRLAVETAGELVDQFADGVWFVDLAGVAESGLVATAVATALGLRPEPGREVLDTLVDYAAQRRMLLLLDTCDAHPQAAAQVAGALLAAGPGVRVLATSREPLGLPGEVVWRIPPLSLEPAPDGGPSEAVCFLLSRARSALGAAAGFAEVKRGHVWAARFPAGGPVRASAGGARALLDTALARETGDALPWDLGELSRVATRLAGLPLAMELAAARLRVLSPGQLAARLDDVIGTLDAGRAEADPADRHATLHATVEWSYRTLGPRAARLLRWLSVFAGRVDLTMVEWLLDEDPLDALAVLVDKSLLQAEPTARGMSYRLLDPIRSYAGRLLVGAGEEASARDRHLAWAGYALRQAQLGPDGMPATLSLYAIDPLAPELRAGLSWATSRGSGRAGLALALGMDQWWRERGLAREGRQWLTRLYDRLACSGEPVPDAELAAAYHLHSLNAGADGDHEEELRYSQLAEQEARAADSPGLLVQVLGGRGVALCDLGKREEAEASSRKVIARAQREGVGADALFAVYCLAQLLWQRGALDEAAAVLATARPMEAVRPVVRGRRTVDMLLGMVALERRDLVAAHEHLVVALRARIGYGFHSRACESVAAFAVRCALGGDAMTAVRLFGAADALRARLKHSAGMYASYWAAQQARMRSVLGDQDFDATYAEGAELTLEEAAALALSVEHPDLTAGSARFASAG